ncbi:MAG: glucosamine-6-phosphate deaminase [Candidatus Brocadiae bacterium]|nr:glucosamine-6-phosphate deaminase [Candidatus Brocadiia bacterium]
MDVVIVRDYEEMSDRAAAIVVRAIRQKPDLVLGLATGSTPEGLYQRLIEAHRKDGLDFSRARSFNLDEYVGLAPDHEQSYRRFMNEKLFEHVNIKPENTHVPDGLARGLLRHCAEYEDMIRNAGGIDLQVLGIGRDGHVAFNEPGTSLGSRTHVTALTRETIEDNSRFFDSPDQVPRFAVTLGIGSILEARKCIVLASGAGKADAVRATVEGPITSAVTASALQMHPDTVAIVDEAAAANLERTDFYRWQQENWDRIADKL